MKNDKMTKEDTAKMDEMRKADKPEPVEIKEPEVTQPEAKTDEKVETKSEIKAEDTEEPELKKEKKALYADLKEERKARQDAEKKAREIELSQAKVEERLRLMNEAITRKPEAEKAIPDPDKDALGALKMSVEEIRELKQFREQTMRQTQQQQQFSQLQQAATNAEMAFRQRTPDYDDAMKHLVSLRAAQLNALGIPPAQIPQQIHQESMQLAVAAFQQGKDPADLLYTLARQSGYTNKEAKKVVDNAADKLAKIEAGQKANASLSDVSGRGASTSQGLTAPQLAKMTDAQFSNVLKNMSREDQQAIFGN